MVFQNSTIHLHTIENVAIVNHKIASCTQTHLKTFLVQVLKLSLKIHLII
jgi:hypothetical protein